MQLIDAGLEELDSTAPESLVIYCELSDFHNIQMKLEDLDIEIENSELQRIPNVYKKITAEQAEKVLKLLDLLEENDDVHQVFHNMELTDDILNILERE